MPDERIEVDVLSPVLEEILGVSDMKGLMGILSEFWRNEVCLE